MNARRLIPWALLAVVLVTAKPAEVSAQVRVGDLVVHRGDVPRRIVGYGLVVGLDGTGDRSYTSVQGSTPTVRSIINLLHRFDIEVPPERLRPRNAAAVLVMAEISPYLRPGGRFEVQVATLGDATSLHGGMLWITPLVTDPNEPPVATAQGAIYVTPEDSQWSGYSRRGGSGRIPDGGLLEVELPAPTATDPTLLLREPDLTTAGRIAEAINTAFGAGTAKAVDPGVVSLTRPKGAADSSGTFLAAVDTVLVTAHEPARIVIDGRDGTVVAGGDLRVGKAVVSHHGVTLQVGETPTPAGRAGTNGLVQVESQATVGDVASGLHAAAVKPAEMAAIFEALRSAGALRAQVVIR